MVESPELQPDVAECIKNSNLTIAYRHDVTHKDYGYICFSIKKISKEETLYTIDDIILDDALSDESISSFIRNAISYLLGSIKDSDLRKDRIKTNNPVSYQFCKRVSDDTINKVCSDVMSQVKLEKYGFKSNSQFLTALQKEAEKLQQ